MNGGIVISLSVVFPTTPEITLPPWEDGNVKIGELYHSRKGDVL
jgi:hypothetical protein